MLMPPDGARLSLNPPSAPQSGVSPSMPVSLSTDMTALPCCALVQELVRADEGTLLPTTIREHFKHLTNLVHPEYLDKVVKDREIPEGIPKKPKELLDVYLKALSAPEATNTAMKRVSSSEAFHASIIHFDHYKGLFSISPEVNQRIVCLAGNLPDSS